MNEVKKEEHVFKKTFEKIITKLYGDYIIDQSTMSGCSANSFVNAFYNMYCHHDENNHDISMLGATYHYNLETGHFEHVEDEKSPNVIKEIVENYISTPEDAFSDLSRKNFDCRASFKKAVLNTNGEMYRLFRKGGDGRVTMIGRYSTNESAKSEMEKHFGEKDSFYIEKTFFKKTTFKVLLSEQFS